MNLVSSRLIIHIFKDYSFSSLREPKRFVHLFRYFYKYGISGFVEKPKFEDFIQRIRKASILSFSLTYLFRLADYLTPRSQVTQRETYMENFCKAWNALCANNSFSFEQLSPEQWNDLLKVETSQFSELFVRTKETLSINKALRENIWSTYQCIINEIPLWIVGKPGTSKSLAVNLVLQNLIEKSSSDERIQEFPLLFHQTYMCSTMSRPEAILSQLGLLVSQGNPFIQIGQRPIFVLILDEIGHADLSPYLPLKSLHSIIDEGFQSKTLIRVLLIGLTNYKMDSAKLNRGLLLLRGELDSNEMEKTLDDIFEKTLKYFNDSEATAKQQYNDHKSKISQLANWYNQRIQYHDKYLGLRDIYEIIHLLSHMIANNKSNDEVQLKRILMRCVTGFPLSYKNPLESFETALRIVLPPTALRDIHFENIPSKENLIIESLKPFPSKVSMRHLLLYTKNGAALTLLHKILKDQQISNYHFFFSNNLSGYSLDEWIATSISEISSACSKGDVVVFVGEHPCFNSLFDILNLRLTNESTSQTALISHYGQSFTIKINPDFRVIVIVEEDKYVKLTHPFLNRFQKLHYDFDLSFPYISQFIQILKQKNLSLEDFVFLKPDNSQQYVAACFNLLFQIWEKNANGLFGPLFFSLQPSSLFLSSLRFDVSDIQRLLLDFSPYRFSIPNLIQSYQNYQNLDQILQIGFKNWLNPNNQSPGIQAVVVVPSISTWSSKTTTLFVVKVTKFFDFRTFLNETEEHIKQSHESVFVLLIQVYESFQSSVDEDSIEGSKICSDFIFTIEWMIYNFRLHLFQSEKTIHTLIVFNGQELPDQLILNPDPDWPLLYLDRYDEGKLTKISNSPLSLIPFADLKSIFQIDPSNYDEFKKIFVPVLPQDFPSLSPKALLDFINFLFSSEEEKMQEYGIFSSVQNYIQSPSQFKCWVNDQLIGFLENHPLSVLDFLEDRLISLFQNLNIYLSFVFPSQKSDLFQSIDKRCLYSHLETVSSSNVVLEFISSSDLEFTKVFPSYDAFKLYNLLILWSFATNTSSPFCDSEQFIGVFDIENRILGCNYPILEGMIFSYLLNLYPYLHSPFSNDFSILKNWIEFCNIVFQKVTLLRGSKREHFNSILGRLAFSKGVSQYTNFVVINHFFVYTTPLWFLFTNPDEVRIDRLNLENFVEQFYDQFLYSILNNFFSPRNISFGGLRIFFQHHAFFVSLVYNEFSNFIQNSQTLYKNFQRFSVFFAALIECQLECQNETFSFSIDDDQKFDISTMVWMDDLFLDSESFLRCFFSDPNEKYRYMRQSYFNKKFISIWASDPSNFEI